MSTNSHTFISITAIAYPLYLYLVIKLIYTLSPPISTYSSMSTVSNAIIEFTTEFIVSIFILWHEVIISNFIWVTCWCCLNVISYFDFRLILIAVTIIFYLATYSPCYYCCCIYYSIVAISTPSPWSQSTNSP